MKIRIGVLRTVTPTISRTSATFSHSCTVNFNFRSVGGAIFMALEGPEEREICNQMREEIKERLEEQFYPCKFSSSQCSAPRNES